MYDVVDDMHNIKFLSNTYNIHICYSKNSITPQHFYIIFKNSIKPQHFGQNSSKKI